MSIANQSIRDRARVKDVKLWEVASKFGITDSSFSRKLRIEFSPEDRKRALSYIDEIAAEHRRHSK